jgi:hypothetical protein
MTDYRTTRWMRLFLPAVVLLLSALLVHAEDLVEPVALTSHAYSALTTLANAGLLSDAPQTIREAATTAHPTATLTNYDFASALSEPLAQVTAYITCLDAATPTATERRRRDLFSTSLAHLTAVQQREAISALRELLTTFRASLEDLAPGLANAAETALTRIALPNTPLPAPLLTTPGTTSPDPVVTVHVGTGTRSGFAGDNLFTPGAHPELLPTAATLGTPGSAGVPGASRPANTLEAAVDVALGRFSLYSALSTLPGSDNLLSLDGSTARVGLEVGLGRANALGITGIVELSVTNTHAQGAPPMAAGASTGIRITW